MVLVFETLPVVTELIQAVGVDVRKSVSNMVSVWCLSALFPTLTSHRTNWT